MRSQETAFERARASLHRLGIPLVLPALHAAGVGISRTVLGGSHSVAIYPPINSLTPLDPSCLESNIGWGREISLYVHIAFCETRCTFCHYTVEHYAGQSNKSATDDDKVVRYLDALKRELAAWELRLRRSGTVVSSIYIGGGTPLVLGEAALTDLIATIRDTFEVRPGAEICIEGSPLTITAPDGAQKLRSLKQQGVTRLSFGVQSFDDTVLKYAARGYKRDVPLLACSIATDIFDNWNLDLIQGLYKGSPSETWNNLAMIAEIRPPHLTWYHARFADRPQGHWLKSELKQGSFESEFSTLFGRMLIWQEMAALGYDLTDGNRFVRARRYADPFKTIRTSPSRDLLGIGAGAYSHAGAGAATSGCVFRNVPDVRAYVETVLAGNSPITAGRAVDRQELLATSYATGLRTGRVEDADRRAMRADNRELSAHYDKLVARLSGVGALEAYCDGEGHAGLRLSELGRLFEDETLALFFSPAVKDALSPKVTRRELQYG